MKKLAVILVSVVVVTLINSCSGQLSPTAYNERVIAMHGKAYDVFNENMERLYEHKISAEESQLLIDSLNMKYEGYINQLNEMKYPDGAENFQKAILELFTFTKDSIFTLFQETLQYEPESKQWYKVWREIDVRIKHGEKLEDKIEAEQKAFAAKSGYQLR